MVAWHLPIVCFIGMTFFSLENNQKPPANMKERNRQADEWRKKAKEFVATGSEIYHDNLSDGVKKHH